MRSKSKLLPLFLTLLFLSLFIRTATAQIRRNEGGHHGSFYFSGGLNVPSYNRPDIHIEQAPLGNSYDLLQVKADNKTTGTSLFPSNLNYRLGYYFNYTQTMGIELSYDPVNFHIVDGEIVHLHGTYQDMPNTDKFFQFSSKAGYYYGLSGSNLVLVNFVKRYSIFRPQSNKVGVDGILKAGAGPVMPRSVSSLPLHSVDDHQFQLRGWNAGLEAALRVTFFRYIYLEFAGKYDYAKYSGIKIYEGTAKQSLTTMEVIGSLGFTIPTNRFNPLFYKAHKIITITSLIEQKKKEAQERRDDADETVADKAKDQEVVEIPDFTGITEKKIKKKEVPADTTATNPEVPVDSTAKSGGADSTDNGKESRKSRRKKKHKKDSEETPEGGVTPPVTPGETPPVTPAETPPVAPTTPPETPPVTPTTPPETPPVTPPVTPPTTEEPKEQTKKEKKAEEKRLKKEQERIEKEKKDAEEKEQERIDAEKKAQEKADKEKAEQQKKDEEDKKAQAEKDKEDQKAKLEQDKEDQKAKKEKELQDLKDKREKEMEEKKAQREKDQQDLKDKREKEKQERQDKLDQMKKEREEKLEQMKKEREEKIEQAKKEREEKIEQAKKDKAEQEEKARKEKEEKDKADGK